MKTKTSLIHSGRNPLDYDGAVNTPVIRTSTVIFPDLAAFEAAQAGKYPGATYGRYGTATRHELETIIATMEGADRTLLYPSGLAAINFALLAFLKTGDHVLMVDSVYGPGRYFCDTVLKQIGVEVTYYDPMMGGDIVKLMKSNTRVVYLESPGSITFEVQDVPAIAKAARAKGAIVMGDNTWATPLYANAFALGMDVSIHSLTKYGSGGSDILMGCVSVKQEHAATLERSYKAYGLNVSADDCYLMARSLRSLPTRFQAHRENALKMAEWFAGRKDTLRLLHPAFESCPGHVYWKRDIGTSCGLFAVLTERRTHAQLAAMLDHMEHFAMGYSWGGFESLMIPLDGSFARTATAQQPDATLLRLHIGLEDVEDLLADLEAGFKRMEKVA